MKNLWSVVCYKGVIDKETNQISLIDVMDTITLAPEHKERLENELVKHEIVLLPVKMQLVGLWERTNRDQPEVGEVRGRLIAPNGKVVAEHLMPINLVDHVAWRFIIKFPAFPYTGLGVYPLVIHWRSKGGKRWKKEVELGVTVTFGQED